MSDFLLSDLCLGILIGFVGCAVLMAISLLITEKLYSDKKRRQEIIDAYHQGRADAKAGEYRRL
jgi:hypothetical protein